jgi:hypothetical protein
MVPGKDTYRLKLSGADKVVWVKSSEKELPEAMGFVWNMIGEVEGALIEGNSILEHIDPDLSFFVVDREITELKTSRVYALKKAHVVVINKSEKEIDESKIERKVREFNPQALIVAMNLKEDNGGLLFPLLTRYLGPLRHNP